MTKTLKLNDALNKTKISREAISKFGEMVYHTDEVESIDIKINFKDGTIIGYRRHERKDDFDREMDSENGEITE